MHLKLLKGSKCKNRYWFTAKDCNEQPNYGRLRKGSTYLNIGNIIHPYLVIMEMSQTYALQCCI